MNWASTKQMTQSRLHPRCAAYEHDAWIAQMAKEAAALVCDPTHTTRLAAVALFAAIAATLDEVDCWLDLHAYEWL